MTAGPDPVWHMGPLPDPGPALTAEQAAEQAEYDAYVNQMQLAVLDGRVEAETDWARPIAWPAVRGSGRARRPKRRRRLVSGRPRTPEAEAEP